MADSPAVGGNCAVMQTLSVADFAIRLAVGVGCGALIGLERQWRARRAGLRTNALVAAGATLFVLYAAATTDSGAARTDRSCLSTFSVPTSAPRIAAAARLLSDGTSRSSSPTDRIV